MTQLFMPIEQVIDNICPNPKCDGEINKIGFGSNGQYAGDPEAITGIWYKCPKCGLALVEPRNNGCSSCPTY